MSSLFTAAQKIEINGIFDSIHDTFQKDIHVYTNEATSLPSNLNYNPIYGRTKDQSKSVGDKVLTKTTISARVQYFKKSEDAVLDDTGLTSSANVVRVKVDAAGKNLLARSISVDIDGNKCSVISDPEVVGPFATDYYKIYLKFDT